MLSDEEKKALERIEDFLTTNIIISISNDETADSEELKAFISKNEYLAIEFIASMFLKQSQEIEELKEENEKYKNPPFFDEENYTSKDKIKAKIEEWQKEKEFYNKDEDREWGQFNNWDWIDTIINEMQSLL